MVSKIKTKLFKSIKSKKLNVFGFFLMLSFLFLFFAKLSKTYTDTILFHVNYENVPEEHSIVPEHDSIIKVQVKAYGFNLVTHNFFKHFYTVNFNKGIIKNGDRYLWNTKKGFSKISSQLGHKIEVLSIQPDTLVFPYEVMTVKTVPVKLDADITYTPGYDVVKTLEIQPDSVKVIGPKKTVEKISRIKTNKLILKDVNKSVNNVVGLLLEDSLEHVKLNIDKVKVIGKVEKFTEGSFEVPVSIVNLPSKIKLNYFPKTVLVSYYVSLDNYKKIKVLDFKVICDYNEVKDRDNTFFTPKLVEKPDIVKSAKIKQNKVEFIIVE